MKNKLKAILPFLIVIFTVCLVLLCVFIFSSKVNAVYDVNLLEVLDKYNSNGKAQITSLFKHSTDNMYAVSSEIASYTELQDNAKVKEIMRKGEKNGTIDFLAIGTDDGALYTSNGNQYNIFDKALVTKVMLGNSYIGLHQQSITDKLPCIVFAVPVYHDGKIICYLYGEYSSATFAAELQKVNTQNCSYAVITSNGDYVFNTYNGQGLAGNNCFDLGDSDLESNYSIQDFKAVLQSGGKNSVQVNFNGVDYYVDYRPIEINDWYLITNVSKSTLNYQGKFIAKNITELIIEIIIIIIVFYCLISVLYLHRKKLMQRDQQNLVEMIRNVRGGVFSCSADDDAKIDYISPGMLEYLGYTKAKILQKTDGCFYNLVFIQDREQVLKQLSRAITHKTSIELEYRIEKENGEIVWVYHRTKFLQQNGEMRCFNVITDITESHNMRDELIENEECFSLIMEKMNSIIFRWNLKSNTINISDIWNLKFEYDFPTDFLESITNIRKVIYSKDIRKFIGLCKSISAGKHYGEEIVRIKKADKSYIWCRICLTGMQFKDQKPTQAVGVIIDIDREHRELEQMQLMAEMDSLSGLYNKAATKRLITNYIQTSTGKTHALMMVDIDNFKKVNDRYGHTNGDTAITIISDILRTTFRSSDILGRVGGDEFIVFAKDITNKKSIEEKVAQICKAVHSCYAVQGKHCRLSVTVGVAMFDADGTSYEKLYRAADMAMYAAKAAGKNGYAFYNQSMREEYLNAQK